MAETESLRRIFLFKDLADSEAEQIYHLLHRKEYSEGEQIVEQGTAGQSLYIILTGKVRVTRQFENQEIILTELGPYDFFGEMALIDDFPTSAGVISLGDTTLLKMAREDFKNLVSENTKLSSKLWESLARNLTNKIRKTDELVQMYYGLNKALCENEEFRELYTSWNFHSSIRTKK